MFRTALALAAFGTAAGGAAQSLPPPVMYEDPLAPQWNEQGAQVASCPAFQSAPAVDHFAAWGWTILELEVVGEPQPESRDFDNPASPTGATRLTMLRTEARVLRSSAKLAATIVARYVTQRAATDNGKETVQGSDPLDGRPGRAPLKAGRTVFAIAFPDPYAPGALGLAALFEHEDELVSAIKQGEPGNATFDTLAAEIATAREKEEAMVPVDPRQQ
jgi:hypothetical protein